MRVYTARCAYIAVFGLRGFLGLNFAFFPFVRAAADFAGVIVWPPFRANSIAYFFIIACSLSSVGIVCAPLNFKPKFDLR